MSDPETQSTIPFPDDYVQARLLADISKKETDKLHDNPVSASPSPALVTQIDHTKSQAVSVSKVTAENPHQPRAIQRSHRPGGDLQAWLETTSAATRCLSLRHAWSLRPPISSQTHKRGLRNRSSTCRKILRNISTWTCQGYSPTPDFGSSFIMSTAILP